MYNYTDVLGVLCLKACGVWVGLVCGWVGGVTGVCVWVVCGWVVGGVTGVWVGGVCVCETCLCCLLFFC